MPTNEGKESELIVRPNAETEILEFSSTELARMAKHVAKLHMKFLDLNVQGTRAAIICGFPLLKVKKALPHGAFHQWIENDFEGVVGFGVRTAQRYMSKARDFIDFVHGQGSQCITEAELKLNLESTLLGDFLTQTKLLEARSPSGKTDPNEWLSPPSVIDAVKTVLGEIYCDPCALPESWGTDLAEFNYTPKQDGLSGLAWEQTAWVCPGHNTDAAAWYAKAKHELEIRNLNEAIICLPESTLTLPTDLLRHPLAITASPLNVIFRESGKDVFRPLPTRSLFVYLTYGEPNLAKFAAAFRDIAVVFDPVVDR